MPDSDRVILEVLFPKVRAKVLRLLFAPPQKPHYVREMAVMTGLALHTVQDELRKLSSVGLVKSWSNGFHRFYYADRDHVLFKQLRALVVLSENVPGTKMSAVTRRPGGSKRTRRSRRHVPGFGPNRPPSWGIFTPQRKT